EHCVFLDQRLIRRSFQSLERQLPEYRFGGNYQGLFSAKVCCYGRYQHVVELSGILAETQIAFGDLGPECVYLSDEICSFRGQRMKMENRRCGCGASAVPDGPHITLFRMHREPVAPSARITQALESGLPRPIRAEPVRVQR